MIAAGTKVNFQYWQHQVLGGQIVTGTGVVKDWTIVGTSRAYVIEPENGDVVHVRLSGVQEV